MPKQQILLAAVLFAWPAFAQPIVSPDVCADGRVTFRLSATNATRVRLNCEGVGDVAMTNDGRGVWTYATPPLEPDIYVYSFNADGLHLLDPANSLLKYNLLTSDSQVVVPGPKSLPWEINDVPHGQLHRVFYHSAVAGDDRDFIVYTPPGYNPSAWKRYPALYLLHGYTDDTTAWSAVGRANVILDNLIARGQARPMLVVMPLGYGAPGIVQAGWSRERDPARWRLNLDQFGQTLLDEVIPRVEKGFRVRTDRQSRAIAGLSMGGTESLLVGLNHLERFAWIGAFSPGGLETNYPAQFPALGAGGAGLLRLLWIGCGREDKLFPDNLRLRDWLKSRAVPCAWVESPGAHSYRVWRRNLAEFAPLLFPTGVKKKD
jgi:enterochelin esterase family protein